MQRLDSDIVYRDTLKVCNQIHKLIEQDLMPNCYCPAVPFVDVCMNYREESEKCKLCHRVFGLVDFIE